MIGLQKNQLTDFSINAKGTLNLLELTRKYVNKSKFVFLSTNKVYGDTPNKLKLKKKTVDLNQLIKKLQHMELMKICLLIIQSIVSLELQKFHLTYLYRNTENIFE